MTTTKKSETGRTAYLTGSTNDWAESFAKAVWGDLGLLVQPGNSYHLKVDRFPFWAADNGCFSSKGFSESKWWGWLEEVAELGKNATCLFATAPDVVGDAAATLERSTPWLSKIRALGLPVAFVAQDGAERDGMIPWGDFDVLFLGGSTEWKEDREGAGAVTAEARRRGVEVHMGRVNSARRFRIASDWDCATADGTLLAFGTKQNLHRIAKWLDAQDGEVDGWREGWVENFKAAEAAKEAA